MLYRWLFALALTVCWTTTSPAAEPAATTPGQPAGPYDVILRGGTVFDGRGKPGVQADVAIAGDRIAAIGDLHDAAAKREIDVRGWPSRPALSTC